MLTRLAGAHAQADDEPEEAIEEHRERTGPWRLEHAIDSPSWLHIDAAHRARLEHLGPSFRTPEDATLSLRTNVRIAAEFEPAALVVELLDARVHFADDALPLGASLINPLDVLQAYGALKVNDRYSDFGSLIVRIGRITINVGSRRLVARINFRNTINAFTGFDARLVLGPNHHIRLMGLLPVTRRPTGDDGLDANRLVMDSQTENRVFGGMHVLWPVRGLDGSVEGYVFGFFEQDAVGFETSDRRLATTGVRWSVPASAGAFEVDTEWVGQFGRSHASRSPEDTRDLRHSAYVGHTELGYTFETSLELRVALLHDVASGDDNPNDNVNNRFDTLYGARRFEYGPTGIFGALARQNIQSPSLRVEVSPRRS